MLKDCSVSCGIMKVLTALADPMHPSCRSHDNGGRSARRALKVPMFSPHWTHNLARQSIHGCQLPSQVDAAADHGVVICLHFDAEGTRHTGTA